MGKLNDVMLDYLSANDRFADLYNGCCFQGRQVIAPEDLEDASEWYASKPKKQQEGGTGRKKQTRMRDIKKRLKEGGVLRILGIEHQSYVDYGMPLRGMDYDVQEYLRQLRELKRRNHEAGGFETGDEFLCRLRRTDRLVPVYTICFYHGSREWDGPLSLGDMMEFGKNGDIFRRLFKDYPLFLVRADQPMDYTAFRTPLKEVLKVMALREDKGGFERLVEQDPAYRRLDLETAETIAVLTNSRELLEDIGKEETEEYNMCRAMRELIADARENGAIQGRKEGLRQGIEQGKEFGALQELYALIQDNVLTLQTAARRRNMTVEEFTGKLAEWHIEPNPEK